MKIKEPEFMKELRNVRTKMAREWKKMSNREILESIRHGSRIGHWYTMKGKINLDIDLKSSRSR